MRILVLLFTLIPCVVLAQVNVDFESGTTGQVVFVDTERWGLDSLNPLAGKYSLHHIYDNNVSGNDVASIPLNGLSPNMGDVSWKFKIRHGYNPSSSNNWAIFLTSDADVAQTVPGADVNGFAVGVNLSGYDDTLKLWSLSAGSTKIILCSTLNWQNDIGVDSIAELLITRKVSGEWSISLVDSAGIPEIIGLGADDSLYEAVNFGIYYRYTSSCDQLFWIDDISISGVFIEDISPPELKKAEFVSSSVIRIEFDEPITVNDFTINNFMMQPGDINPEYLRVDNPESIIIKFKNQLANKIEYTLEIEEICDNSGNCTPKLFYNILLAYPEWGDIIISEIMCDPDPVVSLPEIEYFELYNRSMFPLNLRSLSFQNGNSISKFPAYILEAGDYLLVCDIQDTAAFSTSRCIAGIASMPALNNTSDYLLLNDSLSGTIHGVEYDKTWFVNHLKNDGGWSFEIIDSEYPFAGSANWTFTRNSNGGTPGIINSVKSFNPDIEDPYVKNCFPLSPISLKIDFSEPVSNLQSDLNMLEVNSNTISSIVKTDSLRRSFNIFLKDEFSMGQIYTVDFLGIFDYAGNYLNPSYSKFGLPGKPGSNDIVINEILFDPLPGEPEFIEVYNRSESVLDAGAMYITCVNLQSGDTGSIASLSDEPRCLLPGEYMAITSGKDLLLSRYFSSDPLRIYDPGSLPSMPDDRGRLLLYYKDLSIIDDFSYNKDFHLDLISDTDGVSLERISTEESTNSRFNWHSATALSGWGTPGVRNSVAQNQSLSNGSGMSLSSKRITPDNDGFEDYLSINLNLGEGEWIVDAIIYDDMGYRVNRLCENQSASGVESLYWHGTDENGNNLPQGIYIVFVRAVSSSGEFERWKKVCALLRR